MASAPINPPSNQGQLRSFGTDHICSVVPPHVLQRIVDSDQSHSQARLAAQRTLTHSHGYREVRAALAAGVGPSSQPTGGRPSVVPTHVLQGIVDSDTASPEDKERVQRTLKRLAAVREAHPDAKPSKEELVGAKHLYRVIYDSNETDLIPGTRSRREGQGPVQDEGTNEVYDSFKKTFDFYYEVFHRNSIDDNGLNMVGNVHFDDVPGPPGFDNAYWDPRIKQMVFGNGDQIYFSSFTKDLDVIAHELTHGVTSFTANLPYWDQSGALNESVSDVFGSMAKQYVLDKQTADKADWLVGENVLNKSKVHGSALRSMKDPGTAYNDPILGKDPQPKHMRDFKHLPRTRRSDNGGVHVNSGIPNYAFYLAATKLGGHSWDDAGQVWYSTLRDPELQKAAEEDRVDFKLFADLTCKHAATRGKSTTGKDVQNAIKEAWTEVGVYTGDEENTGAGKDELK